MNNQTVGGKVPEEGGHSPNEKTPPRMRGKKKPSGTTTGEEIHR